MITSRPPLRIGLFGIGLDAYWPQFPGLKARLEGYLAQVARRLALPGTEVVNLGLVDNPDRAFAAGREFRQRDVDIIFSTSPPMRFPPRCCRWSFAPRCRSSSSIWPRRRRSTTPPSTGSATAPG